MWLSQHWASENRNWNGGMVRSWYELYERWVRTRGLDEIIKKETKNVLKIRWQWLTFNIFVIVSDMLMGMKMSTEQELHFS